MFHLFEIIADKVREQVAEYASAQAQIGARALAHAIDPLGMLPSGARVPSAPPAEPVIGLLPRAPAQRRRGRRNARPAAERRPRQAGRPAADLA